MRRYSLLAAGLLCLALAPAQALAETPPSPLRLIPAQADLVLQVHQPRRLVEMVLHHEAIEKAEELAFVQEFLGSTQFRRFRQLVAYYEKELGADWPKALDQIAGGGIALATKFGKDPGPALLVVQGTDAKQVEKFYNLGLTAIEQELARQESKTRLRQAMERGAPVARIGNDTHLALAGSAILLSNRAEAIEAALDLYAGKKKDSLLTVKDIRAAGKLLPKNPVASAWINLEKVHKAPQAQALYKTPRDNAILTVGFGGYLDIFGRTPYACAGLYPRGKGGFLLTVRAPRGREGMGPEYVLHLPPPGEPASLPLLTPKDVLYSDSFYLDLAKIWTDRHKLFNEKQAQAIEKFDKNSGRFLAGSKMSQLLQWAGPYHRLVAVNQSKSGYKRKPGQRIPAFALVSQLREPEKFHKTFETILRGAAFLASTQVKLKLTEEEYAGHPIVGYRFSEKAPLKQDVNNIRFNFSPCFTRVGNQFVVCSTIELCRELIDLLEKEAKSPAKATATRMRSRLYASGGAALLENVKEQLVTQTILGQAVPPGEARKQVEALLALVRGLGTLTLESAYLPEEFRFDIRYQPGK
jgi:hypothetical protein